MSADEAGTHFRAFMCFEVSPGLSANVESPFRPERHLLRDGRHSHCRESTHRLELSGAHEFIARRMKSLEAEFFIGHVRAHWLSDQIRLRSDYSAGIILVTRLIR